MTENVIKFVLTIVLIVAVSEIAKSNTRIAGLLAALPIVSIFALTWLYIDTRDTKKVADLSISIFWLVLPTLPMFLLLPELLKRHIHFAMSLGLCMCMTIFLYAIVLMLLKKFATP